MISLKKLKTILKRKHASPLSPLKQKIKVDLKEYYAKFGVGYKTCNKFDHLYSLETDTIKHSHLYHDKQMTMIAVFHELIHATGHSKRLNRAFIHLYNEDRASGYDEEMIAELGAIILVEMLGFTNHTNSIQYIQEFAYSDVNYDTLYPLVKEAIEFILEKDPNLEFTKKSFNIN